MDLGRTDDEGAAIEDFSAAQELALDDFFAFEVERTDALDDADDFRAIRFHVTAELAGRVFEKFVVDVGFAEPASWTPDEIETSDLLAFAGIDPIRVPALPLSQHVAEKVHTYTRRYGPSERASTRPKDLVDILIIAGSKGLDARALSTALQETFGARDVQQQPSNLPPPPSTWREPRSLIQFSPDVPLVTGIRIGETGRRRPRARQRMRTANSRRGRLTAQATNTT
jgi:hypothetical protein